MQRCPFFSFCIVLLAAGFCAAADELPREWIDPATGHRIVRLSDEPGSETLYFHFNAYTAAGDKLLFRTKHGLSTVNLQTHQIDEVVPSYVREASVGAKSRTVYYVLDGQMKATNLDTKETRIITKLPADIRGGSALTVNADESLLGGSTLSTPPSTTEPAAPTTRQSLRTMWEQRQPRTLYTIDTRSGDIRRFYPSTDWLNHVQFSPTDPTLMMFCHEGPWDLVDRVWTIHTDGTGLQKIHTRSMDKEIAGHEFFSQDGQTIYYDLQTPKGKDFWLAGYRITTGEHFKYHLQRPEWSVHYNVSPDGTFFSGDGGGPHSVAAPGNGQWIYLFRPNGDHFDSEKLVDLSKHDYTLEPNCTFTPDGKWLIFRSNMLGGASQVYAVEIAKSQSPTTAPSN